MILSYARHFPLFNFVIWLYHVVFPTILTNFPPPPPPPPPHKPFSVAIAKLLKDSMILPVQELPLSLLRKQFGALLLLQN